MLKILKTFPLCVLKSSKYYIFLEKSVNVPLSIFFHVFKTEIDCLYLLLFLCIRLILIFRIHKLSEF